MVCSITLFHGANIQYLFYVKSFLILVIAIYLDRSFRQISQYVPPRTTWVGPCLGMTLVTLVCWRISNYLFLIKSIPCFDHKMKIKWNLAKKITGISISCHPYLIYLIMPLCISTYTGKNIFTLRIEYKPIFNLYEITLLVKNT